MPSKFGIWLRGFLMGSADVIPGVSGATVALASGVYERFIDSLGNLSPFKLLLLFKHACLSFRPAHRVQALKLAAALDLHFLLPLFAGMAMGVLSFARVMPALIAQYPTHLNALFFGLIVGALPVPWSHMKSRKPIHLAAAALAILSAYFLVGLSFDIEQENPIFLGLAGMLAISAMILPGISGSYLLKAMGLYESVLNNLYASFALDTQAIFYTMCFCAGILIGLIVFVKIVQFCLKNFHDITLSILMGLMIGSLRSVYFLNDFVTWDKLLFPIALAFFGFGAAILLHKVSPKISS